MRTTIASPDDMMVGLDDSLPSWTVDVVNWTYGTDVWSSFGSSELLRSDRILLLLYSFDAGTLLLFGWDDRSRVCGYVGSSGPDALVHGLGTTPVLTSVKCAGACWVGRLVPVPVRRVCTVWPDVCVRMSVSSEYDLVCALVGLYCSSFALFSLGPRGARVLFVPTLGAMGVDAVRVPTDRVCVGCHWLDYAAVLDGWMA